MKITITTLIVLTALGGLAGQMALRNGHGTASSRDNLSRQAPDAITADGVVEGARPEAAIRSEITGTIAAMYLHENEDATRGSLLVELVNDSQKQQVALAEAELAIAQADLDRLRNGERAERIEAARALENAKEAVYLEAKADWERSGQLITQRAVSAEQWQKDKYRVLRTQAEWKQARAEQALAEAPPRAEDLAAATGRVSAALARLRLAEADLAKTRLTAPSDGRILRVYREPGELTGPASSQPILLFADLSRLRVRAFIEEIDALRVKLGQRAVVTVDGLPEQEFIGHVTKILPRMGQRSPRTDAPEEDFREVLIDLDSNDELLPSLRVHTRIDVLGASD